MKRKAPGNKRPQQRQSFQYQARKLGRLVTAAPTFITMQSYTTQELLKVSREGKGRKGNNAQKQHENQHQPELTEYKEGVPRAEQHQDSAQQIFTDDVVLDVIGMVFHAERQQLQYQA